MSDLDMFLVRFMVRLLMDLCIIESPGLEWEARRLHDLLYSLSLFLSEFEVDYGSHYQISLEILQKPKHTLNPIYLWGERIISYQKLCLIEKNKLSVLLLDTNDSMFNRPGVAGAVL